MYQILALDSAAVEVQEMFSSHGGLRTIAINIMEKHTNQKPLSKLDSSGKLSGSAHAVVL